jgi:N-acyl-D-aspartate/D-glutamate deacylase
MKHLTFVFLVVFTLLVTGINHAQDGGTTDYDVLIKNGRVFDGSLKPAFEADVAIKDGRIVRVDKRIQGTAARVIDAEGLFVMPGFIDLHTHVDGGMTFPENRACLNYLLQGVTTVVVGQCGSSAWPIFEKAEDQMHRWSEEGIGPNAALLAGHGTVREIVMGMEERPPTQQELEAMKALVKEAMDQGAYGLSTGLIYPPGSYAKTDEIIELVKVIAPYGGIYHTHIRSESSGLIEAIGEAIKIAEESGAQTHISHFKAIGKPYWGSVKDACVLIEYARKRGLKITADQYPYRFSNNYPYRSLIPTHAWRGDDDTERLTDEDIEGIFDYLRNDELIHLYKKVTPYIPLSEHHQQFLHALPRERLVRFVAQQLIRPSWFQGPENDRERMLFLQRMNDPVEAQEIREAVRNYIQRLSGAENLMVGICVEKALEGQSLQQIADAKGKSVEDMAIELELMGAKVVPLQMCEEDIEYIMKKEYVGTGSDGSAPYYGIDLPHIRSYATFLHKIKKYGQERKTVSIAHIIRSQTSFAAEVMNWRDRGLIKPSYKADMVVLDMDNIETRTSISNPHQYSRGVEYLLVNGKVVIDGGRYNGTLAGDVIKLNK